MSWHGEYDFTMDTTEYWGFNRLPELHEVNIRHVAHHLAASARYVGGTARRYSTAEHSILMSYLVPRELAYPTLMHDATEYLTGDMVRHIKHGTTYDMSAYRSYEDMVYETLIAPAFQLPPKLDPRIKALDGLICGLERSALQEGILSTIMTLGDPDTGGHTARVKQAFLDRFEELHEEWCEAA